VDSDINVQDYQLKSFESEREKSRMVGFKKIKNKKGVYIHDSLNIKY